MKSSKSSVHAVDDVSFEIERGKTFGLIGESGCGKTTCGNCIVAILEPTSGEVLLEGRDLLKLNRKEKRMILPELQVVFQDPYTSLNPRRTIWQILSDPFRIHRDLTDEEIEEEVIRLLEKVGLAEEHMYRYPYEFSGGQKQRIAVARAMAVNPTFIFLDEPTSSLDVSVQAQILNLLNDLQRDFDLTYLFVTHNIHLIRYMTDEVAIMYLGKLVERGSKHRIFNYAVHPYTRALFSANPEPDPRKRMKRIPLKGEVSTPIDPPPGCRFYPRCSLAKEGLCNVDTPELERIEPNHHVACHNINQKT
ncbi:MAG: ABC transporter ATP-binding protein [Candidatus Bathyarchaeia archaeon]